MDGWFGCSTINVLRTVRACAKLYCLMSGLSSANVTGTKASYNKATNILTLTLNVRQSDADGVFKAKVLTVIVNKGASEENLVKASIK